MAKNNSEQSKKLRIGIPKGSLQEATVEIFKKAGINIGISERSYFPTSDDNELEFILLRAQDIPMYVDERGELDCGITGKDWIEEYWIKEGIGESSSGIKIMADLVYAKKSLFPVRWVVTVSEESKIENVKQLKNKRIATELVSVTTKYFKDKGIKVNVEFSWGATEAKLTIGLVDAIVELTETGSSLRANKLKIIDTVCESTTKFIANKNSWKTPDKKRKIEDLCVLLLGAVQAEAKVGLKMNVSSRNLDKIIYVLPAIRRPTISKLSEEGWVAVEIVIDERIAKSLIPKLKKLGAEGIIEYPLNKVIY